MSSYGKRKGSAFETGILKWLRSKGVSAERLRLAGKDDEGDIVAFVAVNHTSSNLKQPPKWIFPSFGERLRRKRRTTLKRVALLQHRQRMSLSSAAWRDLSNRG